MDRGCGGQGCGKRGLYTLPHEMATDAVGMHPTGVHSFQLLWAFDSVVMNGTQLN